MRGRFGRRVTALVAGPGFGKSTLLTQAMTENDLSPLGIDVWIECAPDDAAVSVLAGRLLTALESPHEVPADPRQAASAIADAVWTRAPRQVALLFDDIHLLPPHSPGRDLLSALLEALPANGHLVVASRPPHGLRLTRLLARGDALLVDESDLAFLPVELSEFAAQRHVHTGVLTDVGGWPALAELMATVGRPQVVDFVWEEILDGIGDERRRLLATLAVIGRADDSLATDVLGRPTDLRDQLHDLPLVSSSRDGWWSLHPLWQVALEPYLRRHPLAAERKRAAAALRSRGLARDSMRLLLEAGAWDGVRDLIVEICSGITPGVQADVLQGWHARLPEQVKATPEGQLLGGTAIKGDDPPAARQLLRAACAGFRSAAQTAAETGALQGLFHIATWQDDRAEMKRIIQRWEELAAEDGRSEAQALCHLGRALLASDPVQARDELEGVPPGLSGPLAPIADWLRAHIMLLALGDADLAYRLATHALPRATATLRASVRCEIVEALRLQGRLDEATAQLRDLLRDVADSVVRSPRHFAVATVLLAFSGQTAEAHKLLPTLRMAVAESHLPWASIAGAVGEAACAVADGDEAGAAELIRSVLGHPMVRPRVLLRVCPAALALSYVLVPEQRPDWEAANLRGAFVVTRRLADALVAIREDRVGVPAPAGSELASAPAHLPIPWTVELCVGLAARGQGEALSVVLELGSQARPTLRRLEESGTRTIARTARSLLARVPPVPQHRLELCVLGPLMVFRDGHEVDNPDVHRERVRQLLGQLVMNRRVARSTAASALWPDFDATVAARNLRVTLNYLQRVLEPDRDERDAPFFLRTKGTTLELTDDPTLDVDAWAFERHLDEAARAEQQGAPSVALEAYLNATDRYRGELLVDLPQDEWLVQERDRLRRRFVLAALRAGHLLLATGDHDGAEQLAARSLIAEPWSEPAYQLLVSVALARGDRAAAYRALDRCFAMLEELGAAVAPETLELAEQLRGSPV
jgi:DNA-binding SARP family transcriptional activator